MAKFCTKCGKPLNEGEVCSCQMVQAEQVTSVEQPTQNVQQTPVAAQAPYQQQSVTMQQTKNVLLELWQLILNIFKSPFKGAKQYVKTNDVLLSIILIVIQGLFTGILINTAITRTFSEVTNGLSGLAKGVIDTNPAGTVIIGMIVSIALSFAYALVLMIASLIFKVAINYSTCVRIIGVRAVAMIAGTVFSIILALLSAGAGIVFGLIIVPIIGFLYTVAAIKTIYTLSEDRLVYYLMVFVAFSLVVYYIVAIRVGLVNIPLIKNVTNGLGDLSSLLGGVSSLGDMMN